MDDLERLRAEREEELKYFGDPPRFDVRMFPLLGVDVDGSVGITRHADAYELRQVVAEIGMQFKRELRFDLPPFDPDDPRRDGVLILSRRFTATFAIAAGAAEFVEDDGGWTMTWIWLHPYERGGELIERAWEELEGRYGEFRIDGPFSPAMRAFLARQQIPDGRLLG
ncbi:hypothetical protein AB0M43_35380 [Longispora sp. NPDC051575]|uniref:hypothetical protein n=1 Tax=Longispora sp. NPDC051575 TaxID=3154943 RepID=UPI00343B17A6